MAAASDVTPAAAAAWYGEGFRAVAVPLDETVPAQTYGAAAQAAASAPLAVYYWVEIGRSPVLADAHPDWMASLGMHQDWRRRFPDLRQATDKEVVKAHPWVPIAYRPAFDAQLARVGQLLARVPAGYRGVLLNDLQGGPASCGCGNLLCRWALDYHVPATAERAGVDDAAARFVAAFSRLAPGKEIVPVWTSECEPIDMPADRRPDHRSSGCCGSVPCAEGLCPTEFAKQWTALVRGHSGPIGLLLLDKELERLGPAYTDPAAWLREVIGSLDRAALRHATPPVPHARLWLVVQAYDRRADEAASIERAALATGAGAVLVCRTPIAQSYEPRIVPVHDGAPGTKNP